MGSLFGLSGLCLFCGELIAEGLLCLLGLLRLLLGLLRSCLLVGDLSAEDLIAVVLRLRLLGESRETRNLCLEGGNLCGGGVGTRSIEG